ncbi:hypothetical protein ACQ4PT_064008 [Festuca glaucescens]
MALVAAMVGADSVALAGDGKDQVVVIGDGIDSVKLTTTLKKVSHAQLVLVGDAKKEKPAEVAVATTAVDYTYPWLVGDAKKEKPAEAAVATTAVDYTYPWHYYQYPLNASPFYEHPAGAYDSASKRGEKRPTLH